MSSGDSPGAFFSTETARALLATYDLSRPPAHVAIIMDGNGRWATGRGLPRLAGHRAGAQAVKEAIASAIELNVGYLTIYSFSSENWTRPAEEVFGLMRLFVEVLERELKNLERMRVRVRVSGRIHELPDATREAFERCVDRTRDNDGLTLIVALNYGSRAEIIDAVRAIATDVAHGTLSPDEIDEEAFSKRLYIPDAPDPDLVIRTSGEMRLSNFLLWQSAYSELYITDVLWPDFDRDDFLAALVEFQHRGRRFGGAS